VTVSVSRSLSLGRSELINRFCSIARLAFSRVRGVLYFLNTMFGSMGLKKTSASPPSMGVPSSGGRVSSRWEATAMRSGGEAFGCLGGQATWSEVRVADRVAVS
jgi:hypothetical protein